VADAHPFVIAVREARRGGGLNATMFRGVWPIHSLAPLGSVTHWVTLLSDDDPISWFSDGR